MKGLVSKLCIILATVLFACYPNLASADSAPQFLTMWGTNGTGDGQFVFPDGIAVDNVNGAVYVIDLNGSVQRFSTQGAFQLRWSDNTQFSNPTGIAVDNAGFVYVTDDGHNCVKKFTADGTLVQTWPTGTWPFDIALGPDGNLYVSCQLGLDIEVYSTSGAFIRSWGGITMPYGIAVDQTTNDVYVVETNAANAPCDIKKFTSSGSLITSWGSPGTGAGQFTHPMKVAVDQTTGNVAVTDRDDNRVEVFSNTGTFLYAWGTRGSGHGQFYYPFGIVYDRNGNVYVTEHYNSRIQLFGTGATPARTQSWGQLKAQYR